MHNGTLRCLIRPKTSWHAQSLNKLSNKLRKVSGTLFIGKWYAGQILVAFSCGEPVSNSGKGVTLQDGSHPLCSCRTLHPTFIQSLANQCDHLKDRHRLDQNLVRLQED